MDAEIAFDESGLVPCVMQDARTGEVLTLAYMDAEALARTRETGEVHFHSRSRGELWHKGATSGNVQRVSQLRYDCDADAVIALVDPDGPACHTGERSCFHRDVETGIRPEPVAADALPMLERTLTERASERPEGSYTAELLSDPGRIAEKVREEAGEVADAALTETPQRVREEAADVLYHLLVLLRSRQVTLAEVLETLNGRRG